MLGLLLAADASRGTATEETVALGAADPLLDVALGRLAVDHLAASRAHRQSRRHARRPAHWRRRRPARSGHGQWTCGRTSRRGTTSFRENDRDVGVAAALLNATAARKSLRRLVTGDIVIARCRTLARELAEGVALGMFLCTGRRAAKDRADAAVGNLLFAMVVVRMIGHVTSSRCRSWKSAGPARR